MNNVKNFHNKNSISFGRSSFWINSYTSGSLSLRFLFSGRECIKLKNRLLSVYPDSFLAIQEKTSFESCINPSMPAEYLFINYDEHYYSDFVQTWVCKESKLLDNPGGHLPDSINCNEIIHSFKGDLKYTVRHLRKYLQDDILDELLIEEYLYHVLLNYHKLYYADLIKYHNRLEKASSGTRKEILKRVSIAKDYIYSFYDTDVSLQKLSSYSCLSVSHLMRSFKQVYNITPHQLLIKLRLERSKLLLATTEYPVSQIVKTVGFDSDSSFSRLFRERFNATPFEYRHKDKKAG